MIETNELEIMKEIDKKNGFLLVLFSTTLCGKCEIAERYLEEVLPQLPNFLNFKCNVDASSKIIDKYNVTSAPSFKLFIDGEVVQTLFGLRAKDDLYYTLSTYLKKDAHAYEDLWGEIIEEDSN